MQHSRVPGKHRSGQHHVAHFDPMAASRHVHVRTQEALRRRRRRTQRRGHRPSMSPWAAARKAPRPCGDRTARAPDADDLACRTWATGGHCFLAALELSTRTQKQRRVPWYSDEYYRFPSPHEVRRLPELKSCFGFCDTNHPSLEIEVPLLSKDHLWQQNIFGDH